MKALSISFGELKPKKKYLGKEEDDSGEHSGDSSRDSGDRTPDQSSDQESDSEEGELPLLAEEVLSAIEKKDPQALSEALEAFIRHCC